MDAGDAPPAGSRLDFLDSKAIDFVLVLGSAATLAYYLVLFTRLPAWTWYPACLGFLILVGWIFRARVWKPEERMGTKPGAAGPTLVLAALCLAAAAVNLFTLRPDADDFSFFHRALYAAQHLDQSISLHHTAHDLRDLPALSPAHLLTSVEFCAVLLARLVHLPPMPLVHLGLGSLALFILPLAYYLLMRELGRRVWPALAGTAGTLIFLAMSGSSHQDWGNFTIVRAWQGKCMLVAFGLPLLWAFTLRFMREGRRADLLRLQALMVLSLGLTGSAFFMAPYTIGLMAGAVCLHERLGGACLRKLARLGELLAVPAILSLATFSPFFDKITNFDVWNPPGWTSFTLMAKVLTDPPMIACYVALGGLLAYIHWRDARVRPFLLFALVAALVPLVPVLSDVIMKITMVAAYWRLAYTIPLPAMFGLALAWLFDKKAARSTWLMVVMAAACLATAALKEPALNPRVLSLPHLEKYPRNVVAVVDRLSRLAPRQAVVLAPEEIARVLGLRRPDIRLVFTRRLETSHLMANYRQGDEQARRLRVGAFLNKQAGHGGDIASLKPYLARSRILVLYPRQVKRQAVEALLAEEGERWAYQEANGWPIWVLQKSAGGN